jgi:acetylornithine deacetylase/succinyl-diaminopimelate desuccinylase-like protein
LNVIPSEIELDLDARLLPGQTPEDLFSELRQVAGGDLELELEPLSYEPGPDHADMTMLPMLSEVLTAAEPNAVPMPMMLPAITDARFFARIGIQTYGFLPMRLPRELTFAKLIHAADERVPADEIRWGTERIREVLIRYR